MVGSWLFVGWWYHSWMGGDATAIAAIQTTATTKATAAATASTKMANVMLNVRL